jgi:membrane-bound lytic murein transglycosylase B
MIYCLLSILICTNICAQSSTKEAHWIQLPKVQQYIAKQVSLGKFKRHELSLYLSQATIKPSIIKKINHPYEDKSWEIYRKHFLNPSRISSGKLFLTNQKATLEKAEKKYKVPKNMIAAILGIESNYGKVQSHYQTLDALATLAFYYPQRSKFFQYELSQYLTLVKKYHWSPLQHGSSYAGAMGMTQFMPSSYLKYAISSNKNIKPDLFNNTNDAIYSIANYLNHFKWQYKQPIVKKTQISSKNKLTNNTKWPINTTGSQLKQLGIKLNVKPNTLLTIWHLKGQKNTTLWVGWPNLKVIMKYNKSPMYAIAAAELAKQIYK